MLYARPMMHHAARGGDVHRRMYEGYQCFDGDYAADSYMLGATGVGEVHGTRVSCLFIHLRRHWKKASGAGNGFTWSRLGKSNGKPRLKPLIVSTYH